MMPLKVELVEVAPPQKGEVRIKIIATGVCRSDAFDLRNGHGNINFPIILGHEASGIVESIGDGVTSVVSGDHVILLFLPQCGKCKGCLSGPQTNLCVEYRGHAVKNCMVDGTTRISCRGHSIAQSMAISTFSEYTVTTESAIVKINPLAPLHKVSLLGCCFTTGYGAAVNTAKVQPGSTCAIWGLGGVGLSTVLGCRNAGARNIIGIDINSNKFEIGKEFGCTDFINPLKDNVKFGNLFEYEDTSSDTLKVDYAFDCIGGLTTAQQVLTSIVPGGTAVLVGLTPSQDTLAIPPYHFVATQKHLTGSFFGGYKAKQKIPELVDDYVNKKISEMDKLISSQVPLDEINQAFQYLKEGKSIRTVILMDADLINN